MPEDTTEQFLDALPEPLCSPYAELGDLDRRLAIIVDGAQAQWPTLQLSASIFLPYLAERLPINSSPAEGLDIINAPDLYIACACSIGGESALRCLEHHYGQELDRVHSDVGSDVVNKDDFRQLIWERVLVASDGSPRIASYSGRGFLSGWLRMTARRTLLNLIRHAGRRPAEVHEDKLLSCMLSETHDARRALEKANHQQWFKSAFADALASLKPEERNLLRYRFVDGLSMQEVARILGIHRVSTSRQLARVRQQLLSGVRKSLARHMGRNDSDFESALAQVQSSLELSLSRLLQ